ncbi:hypothetical protein [Pseudomonas koreensis]|uniref:hypothetical protein n=1 Tax=Pseudomonas koreensis TaxID=198620 RepID=UPI003F8737D5
MSHKKIFPTSAIIAIEIFSLLSTLVLGVLWAYNREGNYEPFVALSGLLFSATEAYRRWSKHDTAPKPGKGGEGGHAKAGSGQAYGGAGGGGGMNGGGDGGSGGSAEVTGYGVAVGGNGGEAGQANRRGKGGRAPAEALGLLNIQLPDGRQLWDFGKGGDGGPSQSPQYDQDLSPTKSTAPKSTH